MIFIINCAREKNPVCSNDHKKKNSEISPVLTPEPCTFNKQDFTNFLWEKISSESGSCNFEIIKSSKDHLFYSIKDAGHKLRIVRSTDHGITWESVNLNFLEDNYNLQYLYIDNYDTIFLLQTNHFYKTDDFGNTWIELNPIPDVDGVGPILKTSIGTLLVGGFNTIYRSTDNGKTWQEQYKDYYMPLTSFLETPEGHIFTGSTIHGVVVSFDDGKTWERKNFGFPEDRSGIVGSVNDIVYDYFNNQVLAINRYYSIYVFDYNQEIWIKKYYIEVALWRVSFDNNGNLYAVANMNKGIFFKGYGDDTFKRIEMGIEDMTYPKDIVINSCNRPFLIAPNGIFRLIK